MAWRSGWKNICGLALAAGLLLAGLPPRAVRAAEPLAAKEGAVSLAKEQDTIDSATVRAWSAPWRGWHYFPDHVIPPAGFAEDRLAFRMTDCPLVWHDGRQWVMFYIGFDGRGYQTARAVSDDLVHWRPAGVVLGYGREGAFDHGGVAFGGLLLESYDVKAPRRLKKWNGRCWALYGCYPKQGGYEIRPGAEGAAWSEDAGATWHRASETTPTLSIDGAAEWEKDCIYAPWLLEHEGKFRDFYNAANGPVEQMGLALSDDMLHWTRHPASPIVRNGGPGSYDEGFCSDGKVFREGDHWTMIYFGVGHGGAHIMAAFSRDLIHWTNDPEPLYKAGGNPSGLDRQFAHKVAVVYNEKNDTLYMFYCAVGDKGRGIGLLTSKPLME